MNFIRQHRNHFCVGVTVIAVILIFVLIGDFAVRRSAEKSEAQETVTSIAEKEKKDRVLISVSVDTIRDGLADKGILITQEYYFTQVETYKKDKKILWIIPSSSKFMYSYDGAVLAGVDFEKINIEKDDDRRAIIVELPASEIQTVSIDKETFKIYSEKDSLWNPLNLEDYNISLAEFEAAAMEKAIASDILKKSDEQAETVVREFISSLPSTSGYTIEFKKGGMA